MNEASWRPAMKVSETDQGLVKSAARVMAILEAFDYERRELTISEIVARLDIPQSSASTLMKSLLRQGFVDYEPRLRTYKPSVRVAMLGSWVLGTPERLGDILSLMRQLSDATGDTILLGAQNGLRVQYLNVIQSEEAVRFSIRPGLLRPMHLSALGIMLLSRKPDDEVARILRHANSRIEDPEHRAIEADVLAVVAKARADGYYQSANLATPGAGMIGTLLPVPEGAQPLAVGIGAPLDRLEQRSAFVRSMLLDAVGALS